MPDGRRWRGGLAAWFAALLAIAPVAQPSLPDPGAAPPAVVQDQGPTDAHQPATRPAGLDLVARPSPTEGSFGPASVKPPLHRPGAADRPLAAAAVQAPKAARAVLQRSAVGTARTPTGPPS